MSIITKEDIIDVAKDLNILLNEGQINQVLEIYDGEERNDPTGTWDLIIEHCIYQII